MTYKQLISRSVSSGKGFTIEQPTDEIPSATRFFEAIELADPEYFENASERLEIKGQSLHFLEAFGRFYCKGEDGELMRFGGRYAMEYHLERQSDILDNLREDQAQLQRDIDQHLLTA